MLGRSSIIIAGLSSALASAAAASVSLAGAVNHQLRTYSSAPEQPYQNSRFGKSRWGQGRRYAAGAYKGSRYARRASRRGGNPAKASYRVFPNPPRLCRTETVAYVGTDPSLQGARAILIRPYRSPRYVRVQVTPITHKWSHGWHKSLARDWRRLNWWS